MSAEYTLDFSIWQFQILDQKKKHIKDNYKGLNVYTDQAYLDVNNAIRRCQSRLKDWMIKLMKLDEETFVGTEIVDRDQLYKLKQEEYNREVLGIKPKNNDDLFGDSTSSPAKSGSKKSPKKKKKKKTQHAHDDHSCPGHYHTVSFVKYE